MEADYRVAVRALCDFTAREGNLDHCFTPAPSAREGIDLPGDRLVGAFLLPRWDCRRLTTLTKRLKHG